MGLLGEEYIVNTQKLTTEEKEKFKNAAKGARKLAKDFAGTEWEHNTNYVLTFLCAAGHYVAWYLMVEEIIPVWLYVYCIVLLFPRYFLYGHENWHYEAHELRTMNRSRPWPWGWLAFPLRPVLSPFNVSFDDQVLGHFYHHLHTPDKEDGFTICPHGDDDIHAYMIQGPIWKSIFGAFIEPEYDLFRVMRFSKQGWTLKRIFFVVEHTTILAGMYYYGGFVNFMLWFGVLRLYNTFIWTYFHFGLHHPLVWFRIGPFPLYKTRPMRWLIKFFWGEHVYHTIIYHPIHHSDGFFTVPTDKLPALAEKIMATFPGYYPF